ncbi:hypothetical protein O6H91_09G047700 [Diphasiastrum complanatum]|uniref:Uncharacterized protein n=1 Tax=Diphasiastrum complanatum TaxID=34168 RepID=A0ACC2CNS3_DIPCM|nr:hypothetical protein O6H91_09G047700 [Diphasiastrum complanatum]
MEFPSLTYSHIKNIWGKMELTKVKSKEPAAEQLKKAAVSSGDEAAPVRRKRGRPRKIVQVNLDATEKKNDAFQITHTEILSCDIGKIRSRFIQSDDSANSGFDSNGNSDRGGLEEPSNPKVVKREGSRRKSKPRRAAGVDGR